MVFAFLKKISASTTEKEFREILKITEQDIKFNRVGFDKCTSPSEFIKICSISYYLITGVSLNGQA